MNAVSENSTEPGFHRQAILVVDDDPMNLRVASDYLKDFGFRILVAQDGESALEKTRYARPDLILLDVMMPGIDGFETCRRLKVDEALWDIPVIFMSALSETQDKVKGFELGAVDYITKPFQQEEVLARVITHLRLRNLTRQLREANETLERRVAERTAELARALEKQQELDRLKSEFIQNVSHELRTPLALARGYAELLNDGDLGELQPEQQEPVAIIARRLRMLSALVDDINAILEAKPQALQHKPVNLVDLVHTMLADLRTRAATAGRRLDLEEEIPPDLPPLSGDPVLLGRVLDNLLSNALKFTPDGGRIAVRLWQEGTEIALQVADTGIGIPADQLEYIFERFYQVDGSAARRYGGSGLGLALVKEIVEAHGGRVTVESQVGQGSVFTVWLPLTAVQS